MEAIIPRAGPHQKITKTSTGIRVTYTPWRDESHLALIRDWIFPHHATPDVYSPPRSDMRKKAVATLKVWVYKDRDVLPHAVAATCSLVDASLHDRQTRKNRDWISEEALQSIYAMAFCRFVNGFVDRDVAKSSLTALAATANATVNTMVETESDGAGTPASRGESSMYAHATLIGLPKEFVDLRHQATHDKMPNSWEWREATKKALEWLYERWWKTNATGDPGKALRDWEDKQRRCERRLEEERTQHGHSRRSPEVEEKDSGQLELCANCGKSKGATAQGLGQEDWELVGENAASSGVVTSC